MYSNSYIDCDAANLFKYNGFLDFDSWWALDASFVDNLNYRGIGWSGVATHTLASEGGGVTNLFIKRQENYNQRTIRHPLYGVPTFQNEFANIMKLKSLGIPTLTPLYFASRVEKGCHQAVLVTLALEGYNSLDAGFQDKLAIDEQRKVMIRCGEVVRRLNDMNYLHDCLYPKHLFYKYSDNCVDISLVDLEKLKWRPWKKCLMYREIERFIRRRGALTDDNLHHFLMAYFTSGLVDLSSARFAKLLKEKV